MMLLAALLLAESIPDALDPAAKSEIVAWNQCGNFEARRMARISREPAADIAAAALAFCKGPEHAIHVRLVRIYSPLSDPYAEADATIAQMRETFAGHAIGAVIEERAKSKRVVPERPVTKPKTERAREPTA